MIAAPLCIDLMRGDGRPLFQAYLITCLVNGRRYVGITSRTLKERWAEHEYSSRVGQPKGMVLSRAIAKHGLENFTIEAICSARTWEDICEAETVLIAQWGTRAPKGYNVRAGGEGAYGRAPTAESIERSAAKHRGKPCHPNTRAAAVRTHLGRPKSPEHCAKIALARTGWVPSVEVRARISAKKMGQSCNVGATNGGAKLTVDQVREARARLAVGESQRSIARSFGIHYNAIWKIANGVKWGHLA